MKGLELKKELLTTLIDSLILEHQALILSALEAKDAATSEESKAENKYDTRGLEASYLAGAQSKRSKDMERAIHSLKTLKFVDVSKLKKISLTSIVKLEILESLKTKMIFILPYAGGNKILLNSMVYQVITPESPMGLQLINRSVGDVVILKNKNSSSEYEVLSLA